MKKTKYSQYNQIELESLTIVEKGVVREEDPRKVN